LLTPLQKLSQRVSLTGLLSVIFGGGAVFGWVASNPTVLAGVVILVAVAINAFFFWFFDFRVHRREGPSASAVAIETLRCGEKAIPSLSLDA
jgi:hypothetical protein